MAKPSKDRDKVVKKIAENHRKQLAAIPLKGRAIQSMIGMLHLWIPRMEKLKHSKNAQTAREMRDELDDLEKILYG
jgi:hypothetical protein